MITNDNNGESVNNNDTADCSGGGKCRICSIPSKLKCSNCNQIYYCSVKHQKEDWKKHKLHCHPFIVNYILF